ncbi:type I methionyl aminopeptidase [Austwickia sp. TVS 96-490-7B]|uniref:type I methionyl aminopeptidase n=1 Tax=Austwickia sp. TVS 96-490-7B TaxID=2830843 RepID=UPI00351CF2E6
MKRRQIETKTPDQILKMRNAGLVVSRALSVVRDAAIEGTTTAHLDEIAEGVIRSHGARPSFAEVPGYRHSLCTSVNEEVVHGIPGGKVLQNGDLLSVDCGAVLDGWHGDSAISMIVGGREKASDVDVSLLDATEEALWCGIAAMRAGNNLNDIGGAIEDYLEEINISSGVEFGIIEGYTGHGIGREMHMDPDVYNYRVKGRSARLTPGVVLAIEPMVTLGCAETEVGSDDWTVSTVDKSKACHWEHTVALTSAGVWVLTADDGGREKLARLGAPYGGLD